MQNIIEYKVDAKTILSIIEISKKIKSFSVVCINTPQGIDMYGYNIDFGLMKTISDNKLTLLSLPMDIAILSSDISSLEKEIVEQNITEVYIGVSASEELTTSPIDGKPIPIFIFGKYIRGGNIEVPLCDYDFFLNITIRINAEVIYSTVLEQKELTDDLEFITMRNTKSEDGMSMLHIGDHLVYVTPNMLSILKGDEASIEIRSANVGKLALFTITKKKKKCIVKIIFRIMDIRKQP